MINFDPFSFFELRVENNLELIVIGDSSASSKIYSYLTNINQNNVNFDKSHSVNFPNDRAYKILNHTTREYLIENEKIRVGLNNYLANAESNDETECTLNYSIINEPYLSEKNLSVVVCIDMSKDIGYKGSAQVIRNLATQNNLINELNHLIDRISKIRQKRLFNIIPVIIGQVQFKKLYTSTANNFGKQKYPNFYRDHITIDEDALCNLDLLKRIIDTSMATSVYNEINNCIELIKELKTPDFIDRISIETQDFFKKELKKILKILYEAFTTTGNNNTNTKNSLTTYFHEKHYTLKKSLSNIKSYLDDAKGPKKTYKINKFLNVLCSIAAIFALLTIVGIPFVCDVLSINKRYHNGYFKFFAANNVDQSRASVVNVKDKIDELAQKVEYRS